MSKTVIETNAKKVWDAFEELETKEMKSALKKGLVKAAGELRKEVRKELRKDIPSSTKKNPKYVDTLSAGVRITKVKDMKTYFHIYTTIASSRKSGSGSYRLHFLEAGTQPRYAYTRKTNHKPAFRGSIKPYNFFSRAEATFKPRAGKIIEEEVDKAAVKINNKKKLR